MNLLEKNKRKFEGMVFPTKSYGEILIIDYKGANDIIVEFLDTKFRTKTAMNCIKSGNIKDRLSPTFYGVGILGKDHIKISQAYNIWNCMLGRCYGKKSKDEKSPYFNCKVSENFKYFPFFQDWCNRQIGFRDIDNKGNLFQLDKDILVKGNKVYSENTCCFVPSEINNLQFSSNSINKSSDVFYPKGVHYDRANNKFIAQTKVKGKQVFLGRFETPEEAFRAYKFEKERTIKDIANKWSNKISPAVYDSLMNWEVEYND